MSNNSKYCPNYDEWWKAALPEEQIRSRDNPHVNQTMKQVNKDLGSAIFNLQAKDYKESWEQIDEAVKNQQWRGPLINNAYKRQFDNGKVAIKKKRKYDKDEKPFEKSFHCKNHFLTTVRNKTNGISHKWEGKLWAYHMPKIKDYLSKNCNYNGPLRDIIIQYAMLWFLKIQCEAKISFVQTKKWPSLKLNVMKYSKEFDEACKNVCIDVQIQWWKKQYSNQLKQQGLKPHIGEAFIGIVIAEMDWLLTQKKTQLIQSLNNNAYGNSNNNNINNNSNGTFQERYDQTTKTVSFNNLHFPTEISLPSNNNVPPQSRNVSININGVCYGRSHPEYKIKLLELLTQAEHDSQQTISHSQNNDTQSGFRYNNNQNDNKFTNNNRAFLFNNITTSHANNRQQTTINTVANTPNNSQKHCINNNIQYNQHQYNQYGLQQPIANNNSSFVGCNNGIVPFDFNSNNILNCNDLSVPNMNMNSNPNINVSMSGGIDVSMLNHNNNTQYNQYDQLPPITLPNISHVSNNSADKLINNRPNHSNNNSFQMVHSSFATNNDECNNFDNEIVPFDENIRIPQFDFNSNNGLDFNDMFNSMPNNMNSITNMSMSCDPQMYI